MENFDEYTDEELIEFVRNDSESDEITHYLMNKYKPLVRKKARALYLVGGDTDDLIQEGMLGLFKALRDYQAEKEASFASFAKLCIERQLYTAIQTSNRQKHQPLNSYISLSDDEFATELRQLHVQNPETLFIDQENTLQVKEQIQMVLSEFENQVLKLYLEGADYILIAEKMGKTAKSIDNALQRIRQKVKKQVLNG